MELTPVSSSNVAAVGYDPDTSTLEVEFKNGSSYQYFDVPETEFFNLRDAPSVGKYLNASIKGHYRYSRL